jgi:hypothetical protein
MDSQQLILAPGDHKLETSIESCLTTYDAEHGLATLHLTLRSHQPKARGEDHQSTTLAICVEEAAAIKLLLDLHEISGRMSWSHDQGRQTQVTPQQRPK